MTNKLKNPKEVDITSITDRFDLASSSFGYGHFSPAIGLESSGKGFYVRVLKSRSYNNFSGARHMAWEYFKIDETGLIIESPRGFAPTFNGRVRINLESLNKAIEKYKEKRINE